MPDIKPNVTIYFSELVSFYNSVYFANAIGDLYPGKYNVLLQYASPGSVDPKRQSVDLLQVYGASLSEDERKQVVDNLIDPASNEILSGCTFKANGQVQGGSLVTTKGEIFAVDLGVSMLMYGHAPQIRRDVTINFRDESTASPKDFTLSGGRLNLVTSELTLNGRDYQKADGDMVANSADLFVSGIKISDNDPSNKINVTLNNLATGYIGGLFYEINNSGIVDVSQFPDLGVWLDNSENLTLNDLHLGPATVFGYGDSPDRPEAPVINRIGGQLTLTGKITASPSFNYKNSLLFNQGDVLIKDATLRAYDKNSPVSLEAQTRFGGTRRPDGVIVNGGTLTVRNSHLFQEADRQTDTVRLVNKIPYINNFYGKTSEASATPTPNWTVPKELAYLIENRGVASLESSTVAGILLQENGSIGAKLTVKDSKLGYADTERYENLLIEEGTLLLDGSTVDKLSLGRGANLQSFTRSLVLKSDASLPGAPVNKDYALSLDPNRPSLFVPTKDIYRFYGGAQVDSEFWHTTYDPSRLNQNVISAVSAALTGASTAGNPHVISHALSFADTLSPAEKGSDQTITLATDSVVDGVILTLSLAGKSYTAVVSGNAATFSLPAADLGALAVGPAAFTVTGTAGGVAIPSYLRSFNVGGAAPASTPHIEAILPSFGTVLEASELSAGSTVLVRTSGFAAGDPLRLQLDGAAVPAITGGVVQANGEASFSVPVAVLAGISGGLHRFVISGATKAGLAAPDAELPFSADGGHSVAITPHVLSIVPSFGAVLSTLEAQTSQSVLVTTANLNDGDQLQLSLFGKTYTAAVTANQASFSLSAADLQALPNGNGFLTISGPTSPAGAVQLPGAQQSFSKDTGTLLQPHILSISPAFGHVLDASEVAVSQIVTVTTETIPDGGALQLSLAGKTYAPTDFSQGTAHFTIPGGDLSALPVGVASLAVNGSAGTVSAPELLYSFTVDNTITPPLTPHINAIAPAFGGLLDLVERNTAQTVVVSTSDLADGQALTLRLNGKTYSAAIAGNQASFSLPSADLQALQAGLNTLRVNPTGQSTPAAALTISVDGQTDATPPHILSIQPSFGSLLSPAEAEQNQTVLVTTTGVKNSQPIVLFTDGLTLFGTVSNDRALFSLTPAQLKALPVGLSSFSVAVANRAGIQAPEAELSFSVDGVAEPPPPHFDQLSPSFGSLLDAAEALQDQTVVVDTTGFQTGDQLKLAIEGDSFSAAIEANGEARFTIAKDVLDALLPGVYSMTVTGSTVSGTVAPSLTRSFSVDGDHIVPLITGIDPSFGTSLDPQEAETDQTIAVLTSRMADGQAIALQLNNKSYGSTVLRSKAQFVLPAADLKALPVGLDALVVTASGTDAPETSQAFTVLPSTTTPDGGNSGGSGNTSTGVLVGTPNPDELVGRKGQDIITGHGGHDRLFGFAGGDTLKGQQGRDELRGGLGPDVLIGGPHADLLTGGLDGDHFKFLDVRDSLPGQQRRQDVIRDFFGNDRIDLSAFEPALTFIGDAAFSGVAGEVRFAVRSLSADLDGDAQADFLVHVNGPVGAAQLLL